MKHVPALFALLVMSCSAARGATPGAALTGPIAPAARGQIECYTPNLAAKTCLSMATYAVDAAGFIQNTGRVMINPDPLIVMTVVSPVTLKGGQVCGSITAQDLSAAHFAVAGQPASPDQEAKLRPLIINAMSRFFGHDLCTAYTPDGDGVTAQALVNGVAQPNAQKVIWVSPADGYHVGP